MENEGLSKLQALGLTKKPGASTRKEAAMNKLSPVEEITEAEGVLVDALGEAAMDIHSLAQNLEVMKEVAGTVQFDELVEKAIDENITGDDRQEIKKAIRNNIVTRAREAQNLSSYLDRLVAFYKGATRVSDEEEEDEEDEHDPDDEE